MSVLLVIFLGICAIILCGGLVNWINLYLEKQALGKEQVEALQVRLDEMDHRLTDIQEVMISLSEKFDRWEEERFKVREG